MAVGIFLLGVGELQELLGRLREEVSERSRETVRLLLSRDRHQRRLKANCEQMTAALKQTAREIGEDHGEE